MKKFLLLIGRISLSMIFVTSAVSKLFSWEQAVGYMTSALSAWISETQTAEIMPQVMPGVAEQIMTFIASKVDLLLIIATLFEAIGGFFVLFGYRVQVGATLLILFIIPTTVVMHSFWLHSGTERMVQMQMFLKNLAIFGGLLILAASSKGETES